jgi:hypothetical protein
VAGTPLWSQLVDPSELGPSRRLRLVVAPTERLPGGRHAVTIEGAAAPIGHVTVRGVAPPAVPVRDVGADFGFARLERAGLSQRDLGPGEVLAVDLYWSVTQAPPEPAPVVFAQLVGPLESAPVSAVASQDGPPSGGEWGVTPGPLQLLFDRHLLSPPIGSLAPAHYAVDVGLYDPSTGERLAVTGPGADVAARAVRLETVRLR